MKESGRLRRGGWGVEVEMKEAGGTVLVMVVKAPVY